MTLWKSMKVAARREYGEYNRKRRQTGNITALEDMLINTTRLYGMMPEDFNKPSCPWDDDLLDDTVDER